MKVTVIRKFNFIISLWLIVVLATLIIFGLKLNNSGFYVAASVFGALLLTSNIFNISYGIHSYRVRLVEAKREFN